MDLKLKGRKAILAGASKGLGRATAELLAAEGVDIAFCARDQAGVDAAAAALRAHGGKVEAASVDLTDPAAYKAWIDASAAALGGCDIFVSFTSAKGPPASEETWRNAFEQDLMGVWRGIDAVMPHIEQSDAASIVVIGTTVAIEPSFGPQPYAAIKAALVHHASALAQRLAPKGIRVNSVSPGAIFIEGGDWDKIKQGRPELYEKTVAGVPMGRLGRPEEIAAAITFLCSPLSAYTTGANLVVDGGMVKRVQF
ncbi:SDR family NAD(P)-dependent oxidoreductase [Sphingomonas jatrophae]|uniref:3-oxoacyl-[acyl-carrier protein] reductase n=1 Tax=Sphingomonas jatrophae TaxID=1166337 RepID=A0A1I6M472_9SPHN|nr:SDR family oxidoreductase [Sphingomonas jatrophae]SFS10480.1 3-oxoacyl-[acyl-carrier protein] reductase [Sphingomonas jatrophae]